MQTGNKTDTSATNERSIETRSIEEIRNAAEQGDFEASLTLANMYYHGEGVSIDKTEARKWQQLAEQQQFAKTLLNAQQGDVDAQLRIAGCYIWGDGVEDNVAEAAKWYRLAAENGNADAQFALGELYREGSEISSPAEYLKWTRMAAEQGHAEANWDLGMRYEVGTSDVPQNLVEAVKWYRKAAESGNADAMAALGRIYAHGRPGIPQDDEEAAMWYGLLDPLQSAGGFYIPGDDKEELKRHRLLADRGNRDSQFVVGTYYSEGRCVERDLVESGKWYRLAAEQGHAAAQFALGIIYAEGGGVKQSYRQSAKWFRRAAEQGDEAAQFFIGWMYQEGMGVTQSNVKAANWYLRAAKRGFAWAYLARGLLLEDLDNLKQAAKKLFFLDYVTESNATQNQELHTGVQSFRGSLKRQLDALIAKHARARSQPSHQAHKSKDPLFDWRVVLTLRGMLEIVEGSTDSSSRSSVFQRGLRCEDPLAGYYLGVLAMREPVRGINLRKALDYLQQTMDLLQPLGDLENALVEDTTASAPITYYDREFETWLLGATRHKHSEIKHALEMEEAHNKTLSLLTHTLNNALSTGPETVRTVIEILGSGLYDKSQAEYKAINNMASLLPVFLFAESLLKAFKLYVSDPDHLQDKWKSDRGGDANISLVMAMALRQSLARFIFSPNHLAELKRLLPEKDQDAIKNVRKSFVEELIPLDMTTTTAGKILEWIKTHFTVLHMQVESNAEMSFTTNATRYMFFFATFSELVYNALKYADGQQPIVVKWFRQDDDYRFTCVNSCQPGTDGQSQQERTITGLSFIRKLMSMLKSSSLHCKAEHGEYRASLHFGRENFE